MQDPPARASTKNYRSASLDALGPRFRFVRTEVGSCALLRADRSPRCPVSGATVDVAMTLDELTASTFHEKRVDAVNSERPMLRSHSFRMPLLTQFGLTALPMRQGFGRGSLQWALGAVDRPS
jgi:hypothetical protein